MTSKNIEMGYTTYNIRKIFFPLAVTCFVVLLMSGCNKKETYTVTFDANGGAGTMQQQVFTEGEQQALSKNTFTREGYIFSGWNGNGANYIDEQKITVTCDMTMYAQWTSNGTNPSPDPSPTPGPTPSNTVTVTFNANGGTGEMAPQTFTIGTAQSLARNAFTYNGYTFTGWNTVQGGSGVSYTDGQTITTTADMTLYAQWSANTVTVTFNANGGTGEMAPQTFTIGTAQTLAGNMFSYDIFHFQNWNTAADGTGTSYSDQQVINPSTSIILYAQWDGGIQNGHKFIDLGLPSGTKWALTNVGSTTPEGYGDYFAWGETTPKDTYNWNTYEYCNGGYNKLTKYCSIAEYGDNGFTDALTTLQASDDAATVNWGAGWRMPTIEDMSELYNSCTHEWTTQNGVNGRKFTGLNGNSIFLPSSGYRYDGSFGDVGSHGLYWLSSLQTFGPDAAWVFDFGSNNHYVVNSKRYYGYSVRPVLFKK
ncbi:MAG: InlB B-repeat-containing protein [Bacteroidales bacterium]|nr:InlB B-repeat-containing protein [Bacteroidales bacterium]